MIRSSELGTALAVLALVAVLAVSLPASDGMPDQFSLTFDPSTGLVTGFEGEPSGTLDIPRHIDGVAVIGIADSAFSGCTGITRISFPESLRTIGAEAFSGCSGIDGNLKLPRDLQEIGDGAFSDCPGISGTVTVPRAVVTLGTMLFSGCPDVTGFSVEPNSRTFVSQSGIVYTRGMTELVMGAEGFTGTLDLPSKVVSVREHAMRGSGIEGLSFGDRCSLESIGRMSFAYCERLTEIDGMPGSLRSIGSGAFAYSGLSGTVDVSPGIEEIGPEAFAGSGITGFRVDPANKHLRSDDQGILYTKDGRTLLMYVGDTWPSIPAGVTAIGEMAFSGCGIPAADVPSNVRTVGKAAFRGCSDMTGLSLPSGVALRDSAFTGCTGLKDVEFRGNPSETGKDVFSVDFYDGVTFGDDASRMKGCFHRDYANGSPLVKMLTAEFVYGGGESGSVLVMYGDLLERPDTPQREGYSFNCWMLDGERYDFGSPVTSDIVLFADWTPVSEKQDEEESAEYLPVLALAIVMFGAVLGMFYLTARE